jgi:DNA-binding CsgD family transcriptional regulator
MLTANFTSNLAGGVVKGSNGFCAGQESPRANTMTFDETDARAVLRLASTAADPFCDAPIRHRKTLLFCNLCQLIAADAWIWTAGQLHAGGAGDSTVNRLLDGGWDNDQQRAAVMDAIAHPSLVAMIEQVIREALGARHCLARSRDELVDRNTWEQCPMARASQQAGFDQFLCCIYPCTASAYSSLRLYRRSGKPPFEERERRLATLVFEQVAWLHPADPATPDHDVSLEKLSPREREVMVLLLQGDSRKEVAKKMTLSQHTVADYLKAIYRKMEVCSRAELLAKCLHNGSSRSQPSAARLIEQS